MDFLYMGVGRGGKRYVWYGRKLRRGLDASGGIDMAQKGRKGTKRRSKRTSAFVVVFIEESSFSSLLPFFLPFCLGNPGPLYLDRASKTLDLRRSSARSLEVFQRGPTLAVRVQDHYSSLSVGVGINRYTTICTHHTR